MPILFKIPYILDKILYFLDKILYFLDKIPYTLDYIIPCIVSLLYYFESEPHFKAH